MNTSVDNRSQVTSGNNTNAPDNIKQTQDPFNPNNHSNQASSETVNNDQRLSTEVFALDGVITETPD
jgi:hypothetical protein